MLYMQMNIKLIKVLPLYNKTITSDIISKEEIKVEKRLRDYEEDRYLIKLDVQFATLYTDVEFIR